MRREDYDVFVDKFKPLEDSNGSFLLETYGDDLKRVLDTKEEYVWTIIDHNDKLYLITGYHYVNRLNYVICENPWKDGQRDYLYTK